MVLKCYTRYKNDGARYTTCKQISDKQNEDIAKPKKIVKYDDPKKEAQRLKQRLNPFSKYSDVKYTPQQLQKIRENINKYKMEMKQNEDIVKPKNHALLWFGQQPALAVFGDPEIRQQIMGTAAELSKPMRDEQLRKDWEDFVNKTKIEDIMSRKKFISIINMFAEREGLEYRMNKNSTFEQAKYQIYYDDDSPFYQILGDGGIEESNQEIYPDTDTHNELIYYFQEAFEAEKKGEKYFLEFEDSNIISKLKKRFKTLKALEKEAHTVGKQMGLGGKWQIVKAGWGRVESALQKAISLGDNITDESQKILKSIWDSINK